MTQAACGCYGSAAWYVSFGVQSLPLQGKDVHYSMLQPYPRVQVLLLTLDGLLGMTGSAPICISLR